MSSLSTIIGFCEDESEEFKNECKFDFEFEIVVEEGEVLLIELISKISSLVKSIKEIFEEDDEEEEDDGVMCFKFSPG